VQAVVGPGVQPGIAATQPLHMQIAALEVHIVDGGDLQFAARRRLDVGRNIDNVVVVEIKAGDRPIGFRLLRLFLNRDRPLGCAVKLDHAIAFGILDVIGENRSALFAVGGFLAQSRQAVAVINIVAKNHGDRVVADEFAPDDEGFCEAVGLGLLGKCQIEAEIAAIPEKVAEYRQIARCRYDQNVPDTCEHEYAQRVEDHRLVVNRQDLL